MASTSFKPSHMELWREPGIAKPEPLRIVKERTKTVADYGTSRDLPISRRGSSRSIDSSESPPDHLFRSLTIKKKRRDRGSVLSGGSFGQQQDYHGYSSNTWHPTEYHGNDLTWRQRQSSTRTTSVGSFLQSEPFRGSSNTDMDIGDPLHFIEHSRSVTDAFDPLDTVIFPSFKLDDLNRNPDLYSNGLRRKQSKGKQLLSKAFNSFGSARSKSMHFLRSKPSKESLKRYASLRNHEPSRAMHTKKRSLNYSRFSFEADSECYDGAGPDREPKASPEVGVRLLSPSYILYPEITVVPEVKSVDSGDDERIWVAVLVTGVLQPIRDPPSKTAPEKSRVGCAMEAFDGGFGHLYGLDVKLAARSGCRLEEVIADPYRSRTLRPGQTELILAKVKLAIVERTTPHLQHSTTELIAELESQLGNTVTDYLAIGVSYRHSAFPTYKDLKAAPLGMSYYATTTRTEAHAIIKRHCSRSSWSLHDKNVADTEAESSPMIPLIRAHYGIAEAEDLIRRVTLQSQPSAHTPQRNTTTDLGHITVPPAQTQNPIIPKPPPSGPPTPLSTPSNQSIDITDATLHIHIPTPEPTTPKAKRNNHDPARQIWTEMRRSSRGANRQGMGMSCSPDGDMDKGGVDAACRAQREKEKEYEKEQARIMELVVRNKRSMGADTLRSIALPAGRGGGSGRGWGWGPPWW